MTLDIELPMTATDIQKFLPHRYPFFLLDKVVMIEPGVRLVAQKNVSANEAFFQGHFPGRPLMPGVLILEALAQAAVIYAKVMPDGIPEDKLVVFSGVESARFRRPVEPGDVLTLEVRNHRRKMVHWKIEAIARVGDEVAVESVIKATEVD